MDVANNFAIRETNASTAGAKHTTANGAAMDNYGKKVIKGFTQDGNPVSRTTQVTDAKKILGAALCMNQAGNRIVLYGGKCCIINKKVNFRAFRKPCIIVGVEKGIIYNYW